MKHEELVEGVKLPRIPVFKVQTSGEMAQLMVALAALVWGTDSVTSTLTAAHRSLTPGPGHLAPYLAYTGNWHAHGECYKTHTYKK